MKKRILLTTSIPYVNGNPHIGHAFEYVQTDAIARSLRAAGHDVLFTAGTDENALKNVESAQKAGKSTLEFVDEKVDIFRDLLKTYQISNDVFIRTSSPEHARGCQKLWELSKKDIYKKSYTGLYCVGCETFYVDGEFPDNICPHHNRTLEVVVEENYFFALSKYQKFMEDLLESEKLKIFPSYRRDELLNFVKKGLQDFSISRPATRTHGWGISVPGDATQNMYVWYDALTNYITALGFGQEQPQAPSSKLLEKNASASRSSMPVAGSAQLAARGLYADFWEASDMRIHVIGKDIIKFHGIYWPAMLQSAGLPLPTHLYTHGFITSAGQKMSKTLGNVVDPFELVKKYGLSATRYYLLREIPPHDDGDYSDTRMAQLHTADLANELGNLVSRTCAIAAKDGITVPPFVIPDPDPGSTDPLSIINYQLLIVDLWDQVKEINKSFNTFEPWAKSAEDRKEFMTNVLTQLSEIGLALKPYLPEVGEIIVRVTTGKIEKIAPLFPRLAP